MSESSRLDWKDIKISAAKFALRFKDVKKEASYKQIFWSEFLQMFGVDIIQVGAFEYYVKKLGNHAGEIDYFWPGKVIIEHKSSGKDLDNAMDQAMDYLMGIQKREELPRYIIVSDFKRIRLMDLVDHRDTTILLKDLPDNVEMFGFLAGYSDKRIEGQHPVNVKAAEVMGELYDILKESGYPEDDLDLLLIRIVFCMFAEDADIFEKELFSSYLSFHTGEDGTGMGAAINEIFAVLNTPYENRQSAMSAELQKFPYVNGGLFERTLTTPMFDRNMREHFFKASKLDWKYISPAIFGSLFQSIMDPKKRRELGAHYTSEENILKAINPLFMDELRAEFNKIKGNPKELRKFWDKLSNVRILDPACGCGNFLIISYREMRRLEMDVLDAIYKGQMIFDESHLFIDHYYGIEIGEFASMVANLSMILMDHLMNMEMRNRFGRCRDIIPLKEKANIVCADSLEIDWESVVSADNLTYIVGNPPFIGAKIQSDSQREQLTHFFQKNAGVMDYVSAWYVKATWMMDKNPAIRTAFVSTNSITQGEQVEPLWKPVFDRGFKINFAYTTFRWNNEAKGVAAVHVIIVGFSKKDVQCAIFSHSMGLYGDIVCNKVSHINAYLVGGPDVFLPNRNKPICNVPEMGIGNKPIDGGNYLFTKEEMENFVRIEPQSEKYFHPWLGAREFINGELRYCLWLGDCTPSELKSMPECLKRVEAVRKFRLSSKSAPTKKLAEKPTRFHVENMSTEPYLIIPRHSSESRTYLPIGFVEPENICGDANLMMKDVSSYHFGILTSRMHMVWMKYTCGRIKSDFRYSAGIVYNNYPWPDPDDVHKASIEKVAEEILKIRRKYAGQSLADLYDPNLMPIDLLEAHHKLDREVEKAYSTEPFKGDSERIAHLFSMYNTKTMNQ